MAGVDDSPDLIDADTNDTDDIDVSLKYELNSEASQKVSALNNRLLDPFSISWSNLLTISAVAYEVIQCGNDTNTLNDKIDDSKVYTLAIAAACSFTFAIVWLIYLNKKLENLTTPEEIKNYFKRDKYQLTPWYRGFKACSSLGFSIGLAAIELLFLIPGFSLIPLPFKQVVKTVIASFLSFVFGIVGGLILTPWLSTAISKTSNTSLFHMGRDGWGRYTKTGGSLGALLGAAIGAILGFLTPIPGGMAIGITLGGSLGSIIGFAAMAAAVPLINYLINLIRPPTKEEIDTTIDKNLYRTKHMRLGLAFGANIGTIIGFVLGVFFPAPGATVFFIAVFSAICALAGTVIFAIAGPKISRWLNEHMMGKLAATATSYDFSASTLGIGGQDIAYLFGGTFILLGIAVEKLIDLVCAIGNVVGSIIGSILGGYQANKLATELSEFKRLKSEHINNEIKKLNLKNDTDDEKKIIETKKKELGTDYDATHKFDYEIPISPWSQRLNLFFVYGSIIGAAVGFLIGTALGGPVVGFLMGTGVGALVSGVIGAIWGAPILETVIQFSDWISRTLFGVKTHNITATPTPEPSPVTSPSMKRRDTPTRLHKVFDSKPSKDKEDDKLPLLEDVSPPSSPPLPPPTREAIVDPSDITSTTLRFASS